MTLVEVKVNQTNSLKAASKNLNVLVIRSNKPAKVQVFPGMCYTTFYTHSRFPRNVRLWLMWLLPLDLRQCRQPAATACLRTALETNSLCGSDLRAACSSLAWATEKSSPASRKPTHAAFTFIQIELLLRSCGFFLTHTLSLQWHYIDIWLLP